MLALLVPAQPCPEATTFYTPHELSLQCGRVVYSAGSEIARHRHELIDRAITGTPEVLVIEKGTVIVDFYTHEGQFVCNRTLTRGDTVILAAGGHGFRILDDAILLEVKQGPYVQSRDKEYF
jgi:hypothetical protein